MYCVLGFLWILTQCLFVLCADFEFPKVTLEAFHPEGFRVSFSAMDDINLIAFHANKNKPINEIAPGEISIELLNPSVKGWSFFNPNLKLRVGDKIYYWVHVQYKVFGYKKPGQEWVVSELVPLPNMTLTNCKRSLTETSDSTIVCGKQLIFDGAWFVSDKKIDEKHFKVAHFIPSAPDFEFCSYQHKDDTIFIRDNRLVINVIAATKDEEVSGTLDLREGCTSHEVAECLLNSDGSFILPPTTSAKIKTLASFKYGTVEIKAKLPSGDWLYPEIYLQSATNENKKIWIAYSRGNKHLSGHGGDDIGGTLLFAGPVLNGSEPERSKYLSSSKLRNPFSDGFHIYSIVWKPDSISFSVDGLVFGDFKDEKVLPLFDDSMHLVLGVGVGGLNDFPDYYVSSNNKRKPWKDSDVLIFKKFYKQRNDWLPSWTAGGSSMLIEYVKIWAL